MAPLKNTRSRNKPLVGRIPNVRNSQWSPDEKQALLNSIKDEKMQNNKFKPSARLHMEEDTWEEIAAAVEPFSTSTERTAARCHQHYNSLRNNMENIFVALKMDGIGWNESTHNLTGSDGAFKKVKKGTALYRTRAFPYLYEVMEIEGVKLPKQAHKHVDTDDDEDEDEKMVDAEDDEDSKKEQKREKKSEKKEKEPVKPISKKDNGRQDGKGRTPGDSEDEDDDKKKSEKAANQKPEKSGKTKAQKKSKTSEEEGRSDDEYEPNTVDDETPIEANNSPRSARFVVSYDELGGEVVLFPTSDFTDRESAHSEHEEGAEDVAAPKTKTIKRGKKTEGYKHETSHSEGKELSKEVANLKKARNKRKKRAGDSGPPSPTTSRSAKQPKITESFNPAAMSEKLKDEVSIGSSRSASPPLEEPKLPSAEERETKEDGDGKGKADKDAPQIFTPVKTSPAPTRTVKDDDDKPSSDEGRNETKVDRKIKDEAKAAVRADTTLMAIGRITMAMLFENDVGEARAYLEFKDDIEESDAYLRDALVRIGKNPNSYMK